MPITIEHSLVRIYNSEGDPAGVGFAIALGKLLTCAHVVISALELPKNATALPGEIIHFDLPLAKTRSNEFEQPCDARVTSWDLKNDVAVLEIIGEPHAKLKPVKLAASTTDVWEHKFNTFGFPKNNDQGVWAMGTLLKKNAFGWIQIQDTNDVKGYFIQPGFSGAPVWDETLKAVVGMIVAADSNEQRRIAYILPLESLPLPATPKSAESTPEEGPRPLRVFLCHSSNDKPLVREIYKKLLSEGWIQPWIDEVDLLPGQEWDIEIEKAVEESDAVIAFLSTSSVAKEGYIQRELKYILGIAQDKPEGAIYVIPLRLDDCKLPRRVSTWQWSNYFPEEEREVAYQRVLKSLRVRYEQKFLGLPQFIEQKPDHPKEDAKKPPKPTVKDPPPSPPKRDKVIPTNMEVTIQPWNGITIPSAYAFVGEVGGNSAHFYRRKDSHLAVLFSETSATGEAFLIDKYAVTCQQYCNFLNELSAKNLIQTQLKKNEYCAIAGDHILVVDGLDRWKNTSPQRPPWLHSSKPFGIAYQKETWKPLLESEMLPVTLVTWWGARLYSLWAHEEISSASLESLAYLPTSEQWLAATQWDSSTRSRRRYPWGNDWNPMIVNFSGLYTGQNITNDNWETYWASNSLAYSKTRPIHVAEMPQNISPVGCVQMVGNTWEWTAGLPDSRMTIKGGCATSPMEHCDPNWESKWLVDGTQEYIGFRCCYPIRRYA